MPAITTTTLATRIPELRAALEKFTRKLLDFLSRRDPPIRFPTFPSDRWTRQSQDASRVFIRQDADVLLPPILFRSLQDDVEKFPEYLDCIRIIESSPALAPQFDDLVGTEFSAFRHEKFAFITRFAYAMIQQSRALDFSPAIFDEKYRIAEEGLYSADLEVERITPLMGLQIEDDIVLDENIRLRRLTDEEIASMLKIGFQLGRAMGDRIVTDVVECAIVVNHLTPKKIGHTAVDAKRLQELAEEENRRARTADEILRALHVFKNARLHSLGRATSIKGYFSGGTSYIVTPVSTPFSKTYVLSTADAADFKKFYLKLNALRGSSLESLDVAIRRFVYAAERMREEDKLVDYLVAAEAMFLTESEMMTEIRHRLAVRGARFLSDDITQRERIYDVLRYAYDVRSKVLHGKEPKLPITKGATATTLAEFNQEIDSLLRQAIMKLIDIASSRASGEPLVDWVKVSLS